MTPLAHALPLAIAGTGLVSSVGLSAAASCAAFRAGLANPVQSDFLDSAGERITVHRVDLGRPWRGLAKLARMAAMAIDEAVQGVPADERGKLPLLLCVAEHDRPGRTAGLDDRLLPMVEAELGWRFAANSAVVPRGRVGVAVALAAARSSIAAGVAGRVLVAATDSFLDWRTLRRLEDQDMLLTSENSDGFMPGEGAGAVLVEAKRGAGPHLTCFGIGFGVEPAPAGSDRPLRADGLHAAVSQALADGGRTMRDIQLRITDLSGPQFYFKEAALLLQRLVRHRPESVGLWHPAECAGELGAVAGLSIVALAHAAARKRFAPGDGIVAHLANHAGQRAALVLQCNSTA